MPATWNNPTREHDTTGRGFIAVSSELRDETQPEDPALDVLAAVVGVGHVLDVCGEGEEVVGGAAVVELGDVGVGDPGIGAVEIALGDADGIGLAAPEAAAELQAAGVDPAVVEAPEGKASTKSRAATTRRLSIESGSLNDGCRVPEICSSGYLGSEPAGRRRSRGPVV
jgi:hypothetical protein